jgi:hypothetical protein
MDGMGEKVDVGARGFVWEEPVREHPVLYQEAGVGAVVRIYCLAGGRWVVAPFNWSNDPWDAGP